MNAEEAEALAMMETLIQKDEFAASVELDELTRADAALQKMIDALATLSNIDSFVPAALRIVAEAFDTKNCSYYEHRLGDLIRLRYWFFNDHVFSPEEIANLTDEGLSLLREQAKGFTVADSHLGSPVRQRTRACVVDHTRLDPPSINTELCKARGWELELNVPLVVAGVAEGALVVIRGAGDRWSPQEILLAERLAQQFALAIEASRISALAKQAAVVRERELAAQRRADELARHSDVLKQTVDSLVGEEDFLQFIGRLLSIASEQLHAPVVEYWKQDGAMNAHLVLTFRNGVLHNGSDIVDDRRVRGVQFPTEAFGVDALSDYRTIGTVDMIEDVPLRQYLESVGMQVEEWCAQRAVQKVVVIPLLRSDLGIGALCLYVPAERVLDQTELDLAYSLAQHVSLAVRMTELAETSRENAVSRERELAAEGRAIEVSRANDVMRATLERLSDERDLHTFPSTILREAMLQTGSDDGAIFVFDPESGMVRASEFVLDPECHDEVIAALSQPHSPVPHREAVQLRAPVVFDLINEGHMLPPGAREWHLNRGNLCVMVAPMFVNRELYGFLGFAYRKPAVSVSRIDLGLIQALSQQVSLAIQLSRLAEESRHADLAQERERAASEREAELSMANGVLRSTLEQLSDERDLGTFPGTILREAMKQIGARDGAYRVYDSETGLLVTTDLVTNPVTFDDFITAASQPVPAGPDCLAALSRQAPIVFDVELECHMFVPRAVEWHRNRGNRSTIVAPIFVNSEPHGFLAFALQRPSKAVSKVDLSLIQSLTQQVSLAIQLTRLAEKSKEAALAQERGREAEIRAAEFSNANEVLRSTLDQLADERNLQSFPRAILKEGMHQTGANDGLILTFCPASDTLTPTVHISSDDPAAAAPSEFCSPFPASLTGAWAALVKKRSPIVFDVQDDAAMLLPGLDQWHESRGNRSIIAVPMFIGGEPYGYFGITLSQRAAEVSKVDVGLIHALAQQATLAIQLTQLADVSQKTAITLERQQVIVQERAHMAREIHDKLAQGYAAILIQQRAMRRSFKKDGESLTPHLDVIERLSKDNLAEARRTMDELKSNAFDPGSLHRAIYTCMDQWNAEKEFTVTLGVETELPAVPRYVETEIRRVICEALSNARRHSRAQIAHVTVQRVQEKLTISIRDEGIGFDVYANSPSFGIPSMHERAARAGADLEIISTVGNGTDVRVTLGR